MSRPVVTDEHRTLILRLADAGWKAADIADEVGFHIQTVYRIAAGRLIAKRDYERDYSRLRRIVQAGEQIAKGERQDLPRRFGLKDSHSFRGVLHYARKTLAAEARA